MLLQKIATKKVVTVPFNATIEEAAKIMREYHVGDLIVVKKEGSRTLPIGIITDRDIVVSTTAFGVAPWDASVSDTMVSPFITARATDHVDHVLNLMKEHGVKRIPLVNEEGDLCGIISADDITTFLSSELNDVTKIIPRQRDVEIHRRPKY